MRELDQAALEKGGRALAEISRNGEYASTWELELAATAIRAYLDATAPSRAPDGGEDVDGFIAKATKAINGKSEYIVGINAQELSALCRLRLAASRAGDRERLRERLCDSIREHVYPVEDDGARYLENVEYAVDAALAPAAGQDDAGEAQPQAPVMGGEGDRADPA